MKKGVKSKPKPLPRRKRVAVIDRDATIFSSWEIAYACYEEAFDRVVSGAYPPSAKLSKEEYTLEYHPFDKFRVYRRYYPGLTEKQLEEAGGASWLYYKSHFAEERFNQLIPGMDKFLAALKAEGNRLVVLTSSEGDWKWIRRYNLPIDDIISLVRLREAGELKGGEEKGMAIFHVLRKLGRSPEEAVTIGDHPLDHVEDVFSIGSGYGLGSPEAQEELKKAVKFYAATVGDLYKIFGF